MREFPECRSPVTFAVFFGRELRRYRVAAGLSQEQVGVKTNYAGAFIGLVEQAKRTCPRDLAERADGLLDARGALGSLWAVADEETRPGRLPSLVRAESEAETISEFQPLVFPGLLQTEPYAAEVIRAGRPEATEQEIQGAVAARMRRRAVLDRQTPPRYWLILDEAVLRRVIGSHTIMFDALTAVLDASDRPRVTVQVLPFGAGAHPALDGPLTLIEGKHKTAFCQGHTAGRIITDPEETAECAHAFGLLQSAALSVRDSLDLIRGMRDGYRT